MTVTIDAVNFETRYKKLNEQQRKAVDTIDGPLMVIAGPGTGKTELLSMRAATILRRTDTLPENILCLTFTESGAAAMRKRLTEIIGKDAYKVAIHTFHSFGSEIINQYGEYFYHGANFRPASDLSSYELLRSIFDTLDFSNPLSGKMNDEYTHLSDTLTTISELKKSGLTNDELLKLLDANDAVLDAVEKSIATAYGARVSNKTAAALSPIVAQLGTLDSEPMPPGITPLANVLALSIAHAVDASIDQDSTKPITAWKSAHMEKNEKGELVFKDRRRSKKLRAVSFLYYQYLIQMQEAELYDFDDMVLRVVHAMEVFPDLTYNLQEKYLYVMVDEFQDTNLAQARILHTLTSTPSGDESNIMVVGDDDQAIYSFQGAEVGNILNFRDRFESVKIITLTDNYRSTSEVLGAARTVIVQGQQRLERYLPEVDKTLTAHRVDTSSSVIIRQFSRIEDERRGVARAIKQQIEGGIKPSTIAVLARRHHELVALLPFLQEQSIHVNYERRDNVLESEVVVQLLFLVRIVCHLSTGEIDEADALIPQLIAHPAWGYENEAVWNLSLNAYKHRSGWLEEMATVPVFKPLHEWLVALSRSVSTEPAEHILDMLTGSPSENRSDGLFHSPLFPYFFSESLRNSEPDTYVTYLEALRTIRAKLREYRPDQSLSLHDFIEFVDLHQGFGSSITSIRVRSDTQSDAINLMTTHKSKGLEFDHVHIVGAVDSSWGERVRGRSRLIGYPENLPIQPSGDSMDERLRLFFVAMTRARISLTVSLSSKNENGRELLPASFLIGGEFPIETIAASSDTSELVQDLRSEWYDPFVSSDSDTIRQVLAHSLDTYKLSVTHLTSYLDITRGGPQYFLVNNLLHFPTAKHPSAQYGSAIHSALQKAHSHLTATGKRKPIEDILQDFENLLTGYHMAARDTQNYLQRGMASLSAFLAKNYDQFHEAQKVEVSFSNQQSLVGDAVLNGALDLIDINDDEKTMVVTDYKTGGASTKWQGKTDTEKLKLHKYKQQLMFYKLLVENSRDFSSYRVDSGVLQFVEPTPGGDVIDLALSFDQKELDDFSILVQNVYRLITSLTLPDIQSYPLTFNGVQAFEDDIRTGKY
ncbi:ATP-dependent helicase [Candidatus Saccharibacteria bacterium]|nr:ATP-dependent helicase [Candidatus Saccharibacteria bacterium]